MWQRKGMSDFHFHSVVWWEGAVQLLKVPSIEIPTALRASRPSAQYLPKFLPCWRSQMMGPTYPVISLLKLNGAPDSLDLKNISRPIQFWGQDARVPSWSGPRLCVCFTPSSNPSSNCICNHVLHFSSMGSVSFRAQHGRVVSFSPPEFEAVRRALAHPLLYRQEVYGSGLRKVTQGYADADADSKSNSPLRSR